MHGRQAHHTYLTQRSYGMMGEAGAGHSGVPASDTEHKEASSIVAVHCLSLLLVLDRRRVPEQNKEFAASVECEASGRFTAPCPTPLCCLDLFSLPKSISVGGWVMSVVGKGYKGWMGSVFFGLCML